eukprot:scaffold2914_cov156-Ochromonas_danica.AAC.10
MYLVYNVRHPISLVGTQRSFTAQAVKAMPVHLALPIRCAISFNTAQILTCTVTSWSHSSGQVTKEVSQLIFKPNTRHDYVA